MHCFHSTEEAADDLSDAFAAKSVNFTDDRMKCFAEAVVSMLAG